MPLHGSHVQKDASTYFNTEYMKIYRVCNFPENIIDYYKLIDDTKKFIELMNSIYEELEDSNNSWKKEDILYKIRHVYKECDSEMTIFKESKYFIFHTGGYYIQTTEGNKRNWIYSHELDSEIEELKNYLRKLESVLVEKNIRIGLEIALLRL